MVNKLPNVEKQVKEKKKKNERLDKWIRKMGGRSLNITSIVDTLRPL